MAVLRLFASAREAAGTGRDTVEGATVAAVLAEARRRYGHDFAQILDGCGVWVNGEPAHEDLPVGAADEVAVLPPVSGGAGGLPDRRPRPRQACRL
ncbi:MAG: MoaD/ThiS family protein [Actinobacteria bacterium]|nr:MoaD/ThiS family protein [Actinomycetota bacterium]